MGWIDAAALSELDHRDRIVVRLGGRQILVVRAGERIHAVPNRCPHEGYPLSEGVLDQGCVLTCHWHNWKFDLESGATLIGGDRLAPLPVRIEGGRILLDVSPPDPAARRRQVLANVEAALD